MSSSRPDFRLDWCSARAARYACVNWHYSGTLPTSKINPVGVWEQGKFTGAVVFGLGASPGLGKPYGVELFEVCELVRVALSGHSAPVSAIVARAVKMCAGRNPGLRLFVSFADPYHGHNGTIYQAMNWVYAGTTGPSSVYRLQDGTIYDVRRFNGHGFNAPKPIPRGAVRVRVPGKHRYLYPLDPAMRAQIAPLAKPYPKRACEPTSVGSGDQPAQDGATPIRTLQEAAP